MTVPATFLNTSALLCISPARLAPPAHPVSAAVAVEVTNNAAVGGRAAPWSTFSRSGVSFQYEESPDIVSVVPYLGPVSGNFSVRVTGGSFPDTLELRCGIQYDIETKTIIYTKRGIHSSRFFL